MRFAFARAFRIFSHIDMAKLRDAGCTCSCVMIAENTANFRVILLETELPIGAQIVQEVAKLPGRKHSPMNLDRGVHLC